jgi:hypothetical protein
LLQLACAALGVSEARRISRGRRGVERFGLVAPAALGIAPSLQQAQRLCQYFPPFFPPEVLYYFHFKKKYFYFLKNINTVLGFLIAYYALLFFYFDVDFFSIGVVGNFI